MYRRMVGILERVPVGLCHIPESTLGNLVLGESDQLLKMV